MDQAPFDVAPVANPLLARDDYVGASTRKAFFGQQRHEKGG